MDCTRIAFLSGNLPCRPFMGVWEGWLSYVVQPVVNGTEVVLGGFGLPFAPVEERLR